MGGRKLHPKPNLFSSAVLAFAVWLLLFNGGGSILSPTKPTAVTYVHDEKAVIPSPVLAALAELNTQGIVATAFPDDTTDGDNQVPDQYKIALPAAKASGIPSLVVQAGDKVVRVVKGPTSKAAVMEAAK